MDKKVEFESISASCSSIDNYLFNLDSKYSYYDCTDSCIIWNNIAFYGIPSDLTDEQMDNIYEGDYHDAIKIGELLGCLILCKQILNEGYDPVEICDNESGELEYAMSALSDIEGPLNLDSGDPYQDVYYIHELNMFPSYDDELLKSKIIDELPRIIISLLHASPEIIAYYPSPLEYEPDPNELARNEALKLFAAQKMEAVAKRMNLHNDDISEDNKIINFGDGYRFNDDELKIVMGRRHSGSSYPEEAKDKSEFAFYEANGFIEAGDSRLLYKYADWE